MKQFLFFTILLCMTKVTLSQTVGINTTNPLAIFHIDGKADNTTTPNNAQIANDIVITSDGNIGIGTIAPSLKLEINTGGTASHPIKGFKLSDGNEGAGKFLVCDTNGVGSWQSALTTALVWNANHKFVIPHTGIYLITLYLDDNNTTNAYTNRWANPPLQTKTYNGVALYSDTRGSFLIANSNTVANYGVSCSGTILLNAGEVVGPGALNWNGNTPILGVEIIPL